MAVLSSWASSSASVIRLDLPRDPFFFFLVLVATDPVVVVGVGCGMGIVLVYTRE